MAITHGMNPDEVDDLARQLNETAGQINDICSRLNNTVGSTTWVGPDAEMFKSNTWPESSRLLTSISGQLGDVAKLATTNARQQRDASA